jgi:hypothetical protein
MFWLIYAESANYCGYGQHFVVEAETDEIAEYIAEASMNAYFYERDVDELVEDDIDADENCLYTICSTEQFDETHEHWGWYNEPNQSEFYIRVNF